MARIGIIGGGLSGLIVAWRRATRGDAVTLFEAGTRLGGQLWTDEAHGFIVEHGAEGFIARSTALPALAADLGAASRIVGQLTLRSYGYDGAHLRELAPGDAGAYLGFQVPKNELGQGVRTFSGGMGELAHRVANLATGAVTVSLSARIAGVARDGSGAHVLTLSNGSAATFDAIVVATGGREGADLLEPLAGEPARALRTSPTLSSVTVSLAYDRDAVEHPLDATGFVVAEGHQHHGFRACTFVNSKFADRAPAGQALLRAFFRPAESDLAVLDDAAWTLRAHTAVSNVLDIAREPHRAWVSRWDRALPVFTDGHRGCVAALERALAGTHVHLCGSAFHGAGIDAAVRSAEACARALDTR